MNFKVNNEENAPKFTMKPKDIFSGSQICSSKIVPKVDEATKVPPTSRAEQNRTKPN